MVGAAIDVLIEEPAKRRVKLIQESNTLQKLAGGVAAFARVCFEETGIPERSANIRHVGS